MLKIYFKPIITCLSITMLCVLVLTFQNCAKPLDEIGINQSLSTGVCEISVAKSSIFLGQKQEIKYNYSPSSFNLRLVITNNSSGSFTENIYAHSGTLDVSYSQQSQVGSYTVYGVVESKSGDAFGNCQNSYSVRKPPKTGGPLPPTPVPPPAITDPIVADPPVSYSYQWSASGWSACSAKTCGTSGKQTRTVSCKRNDNKIVAVSNCSGTKPATSRSCSAPACPKPNPPTPKPPGGGGGGGSCKLGKCLPK